MGEIIPQPSTIRGFRCTALFYSVPIRTIPRAASFNRRCRHPFLSVPPLMPPSIFIGAAACRHWCRPRAGSFPSPAKREVKREASKRWQAWPGNQTSSRSLVRSLVWTVGRGRGPPWRVVLAAPPEIRAWKQKSTKSGHRFLLKSILSPKRPEASPIELQMRFK